MNEFCSLLVHTLYSLIGPFFGLCQTRLSLVSLLIGGCQLRVLEHGEGLQWREVDSSGPPKLTTTKITDWLLGYSSSHHTVLAVETQG